MTIHCLEGLPSEEQCGPSIQTIDGFPVRASFVRSVNIYTPEIPGYGQAGDSQPEPPKCAH